MSFYIAAKSARSARVIKAALFDLDDTLYPERSYVESGFRVVSDFLAKRFGLDRGALAAAMEEALRAEGRGKIFDRVLQQNNLDGQISVAKLVSLYRGHVPVISLFPDVIESLAQIRRAGLKLGLVTDGALCVQQNKVASLGLDAYVDAVIYCDSFGRECWKPHPAGFRRAAELLEVEPESCAFIGNDPAKDFPAPLSLGMLTIHLRRANSYVNGCFSAHLHVSGMDAVVGVLGVL
jgi:putative hydrolase of the HAD superfamily